MSASRLDLDFHLVRGGFDLAISETLTLEGVTVLFGPNGSGKSMTLRTIAGLESGAEGLVRFDDTDWLRSDSNRFVAAHQRPVAHVFQDARLFSHLDVAGNLGFAQRRAKGDGPEVLRDDVIDVFDIAHLLQRMPQGLSGGERQRVAMARALLTRPRLVLMDEPLSALDVQRRAQALNFIEQIPERFQVPVVYVTHHIDEVVRLANQLVLIAGGRIEASGQSADLMSRLDLPPFTGRFEAGSIIEAKVHRHNADFALTELEIAEGACIEVPFLDFPVGEIVRLRVRARDVSIATTKPTGISLRNVLPASVEEVQAEADTAFAEVRLSVAGQAVRARISRASAHELKLKPGKQVHAMVKATALDRRLLTRR
ncbi:MAG: molybdenum ABC transporter ATP-binding protein [Anderseniella sp.]